MKLCFSILLLALVGTLAVDLASAQDDNGVRLSGTVVSLKRSTDERKIKENDAIWNLDVMLVLRNTGSKTAILYDCFNRSGCTVKLEFLKDAIVSDNTGSHVTSVPFFVYKPSEGGKDHWLRWTSLMMELDQPRPPSYLLIKLEPGQTIEKRQLFEVHQEFKNLGEKGSTIWENTDRPNGDTSRGSLPVSDAVSFRIQYNFVPTESVIPCDHNFKNPENSYSRCVRPYHDPDILFDLRRKWKQFGDFPVDSGGTFALKSEIILNLPKSVTDQLAEKNSNP